MAYKKVQFIAYCINTAPAILKSDKQVYLGLPSEEEDIKARISLVRVAIEKAHESASRDKSDLKIFMMPEFFFRGSKGTYEMLGSDDVPDDKDKKYGYADIISGLQSLVLDEKWKDWIFVFGTIVAKSSNEKSPDKEEAYNVSLVQKGGPNPITTDKLSEKNARIVMKEHKSQIDFIKKSEIGNPSGIVLERVLHPLTEGEQKRIEGNDALWLLFLSNEEAVVKLINKVKEEFEYPDKAAEQLLHSYKLYLKDNLFWFLWNRFLSPEKVIPLDSKTESRNEFFTVTKTGHSLIGSPIYHAGTSIFEMDGIKFGLEVCLDHSYSRLKESEEYRNGERVDIQLIPSCGMSIKSDEPGEPGAIAVRDGGYIFNCDGIYTHILTGTEKTTSKNNPGREYLYSYESKKDGKNYSVYDSHSALAIKNAGTSELTYTKDFVRIPILFETKFLYALGAGELHVYPPRPLTLKLSSASSFATSFSKEAMFLSGMKVIFDNPVSVYPVTLNNKKRGNDG